jgi:two-component system response regulator GlrR
VPKPPALDATIAVDEGDLVPVRNALLRVLDGPAAGTVLDPLPVRTLIGRQPWCDLILQDPKVSAIHCELLLDRDSIRVRDRNSTNGVWAGGARLLEALVEPGTVLRVGGSQLRIEARAEPRVTRRRGTDASGRLVGASAPMQGLFDMLARVAARELPVLLLGETGTGKTAVAEALHAQSGRRDGPFVALNCGGIPADLVESTLFGHEKGAFTGAVRDVAGVFQQARGGTLFLDELGELPAAVQPKLLTALDAGRVRPVGGEQEQVVDFRLVTATNRSLWDEVEAGRFRSDLYYRIAGIELTIPPLRERADDLGPLATRLLERLAAGDPALRGTPRLVPEAFARLRQHPWPGNVRELANVLARASALAGDDDITPEHIFFRGWSAAGPEAPLAADPALDTEGAFKDFKAALLARHERAYFARLMERVEGNITRGAVEAGISRTHLLTMLRRHGLYEV